MRDRHPAPTLLAWALAAGLAAAPRPARAEAPAPATATAAQEGREAKARAWFTNTPLFDQDGRERRFYDDVLRGHVVLLSFMFADCFDACPLITQKMNVVRRELGEAFGGPVRFVSLTVDPAHDTPARLRAFAAKQGALDPAWTFLTGPTESVYGVLRRLGQQVGDPADHNTGFFLGDTRTGHWLKVRPDMPPASVAEMVRRLLEEAGPAAGPAPAVAPATAPGSPG